MLQLYRDLFQFVDQVRNKLLWLLPFVGLLMILLGGGAEPIHETFSGVHVRGVWVWPGVDDAHGVRGMVGERESGRVAHEEVGVQPRIRASAPARGAEQIRLTSIRASQQQE